MTPETLAPVAPPATGHLVVTIDYDHDIEGPNDWDGPGWKLYSFSQKHNHYKHWEELGIKEIYRNVPPVVNKVLKRRLGAGLAFMVGYFEHGQCSWFLSDGPFTPGIEFQWDGVQYAGLLSWEGPSKHAPPKEKREQAAIRHCETFTYWANGECYWVRVEDPNKSCDSDDRDVFTSSGYYGSDDLELALREEHCLDGRRVLLQGKAKGAITLSKCGVGVVEIDEDDLDDEDD